MLANRATRYAMHAPDLLSDTSPTLRGIDSIYTLGISLHLFVAFAAIAG